MWCWRRLLRVPWTARRSNQSILKEINPGYSLEGLMLKPKPQYFGHLMWRTNSRRSLVKYKEAWHAAVHGVAKTRTQLRDRTSTKDSRISMGSSNSRTSTSRRMGGARSWMEDRLWKEESFPEGMIVVRFRHHRNNKDRLVLWLRGSTEKGLSGRCSSWSLP